MDREIHHHMTRKHTFAVTALMFASVAGGYWLGYQQGRSISRQTLTPVTSLRQIGLQFRQDRNDLSGPFVANTPLPALRTPAEDR